MSSTAGPLLAAPSRRFARRRADGIGVVGWISVGVIAVFVVLAIFGPVLAPHDPNAIDILNRYAGSSAAHPLGTDATGRDLLSRLMEGARTSLLGPLLIVVASTLVGATIAITSAWVGGWFDQTVSRVVDAIFAFPGLLLAILAVAMFGAGLTAPVIALSIVYVPYTARLTRASALRQLRLPYVEALRVQGFSPFVICGRHVVPNILTILVAQATVSFGYAVVDLATVSYLGLGIQPPKADLGSMVATGQTSILEGHPAQSIYAGLLIVLAVTAFNLLGERLGDRGTTRVR
jgi:peptide/nickel transport system permease protein